MGTGLVEAFSEPCPHCGGRGIVLHDLPVLASAIEDNSGDRRPAKGRRGRGRDADRVVEDVIPRVVEPVGRRPDPRGPKPPIASGVVRGEREQRGGQRGEQPAAVAAAPPAEPPVGVDVDTDEIDWIEAAASAGIRAAQDADEDEDGFEAREQGYSDGADASAADAGAAAADAATGDPNEPVEIVIELDHSSDDGQASEVTEVTEVTEVAEITEVAVEPIAPVAEAAPAGRRRGRRAAGRPAGAPATASEPVDIIVRESLPATIPDGPPAWDSGADGSNGHAANGNGELPAAAANGEADQLPGDFAATAEPVAATSPPRRRRAASRPAGPAAGVAAAEPLIVSIPAEQHSS